MRVAVPLAALRGPDLAVARLWSHQLHPKTRCPGNRVQPTGYASGAKTLKRNVVKRSTLGGFWRARASEAGPSEQQLRRMTSTANPPVQVRAWSVSKVSVDPESCLSGRQSVLERIFRDVPRARLSAKQRLSLDLSRRSRWPRGHNTHRRIRSRQLRL